MKWEIAEAGYASVESYKEVGNLNNLVKQTRIEKEKLYHQRREFAHPS